MKVFGSDGFRSRFGTKYMTEDFLSKFSTSFADFCNGTESRTVVIGRDTRSSGKIIEDIISKTLSDKGIEVTLIGVVSTPGLAYLTKENNFSYGIMITASHNPASDNGIKIFSNTGFKLDSNSEKIIEHKINNLESTKNYSQGVIKVEKKQVNKYIKYLNNYDLNISKNKYLIDCSNGSNSNICSNLFRNNDNIKLIYNTPDGNNINFECGALESDNLHKKTIENKCDYGIAFDGDGDRAIFCNKDYGPIETEKIIAFFAKNLFERNTSKSVVSTEISNMGLKQNLLNFDMELIETELGDRLVVNETINSNSILGAETSGHYFFPSESTTMDGLLTFLKFVKIIETSKSSFIAFIKKLKHYSLVTKNIKKSSKLKIKNIYSKLRKEILDDEKIVLRESMWDPVIRVYYNYNKLNRFSILEKIINEE